MNRKELEEKVLDILREQLGYYEDIQLETKLKDDTSFDSLDVLEVSFKIEDKFGIHIEDDFVFSEAIRQFTAKDVVDEVEKRLWGKESVA